MTAWFDRISRNLRDRLGGARRAAVSCVLQLEVVECGAACLGMILGFYGRWVVLEELRRKCGVSRDGSTAINVLRAARSYGLTADGRKCEVGDLAALRLPFVIFWNFNHFVVVSGFSRGRVELCDPAVGRRWVSDAEFDKSFTGVVLTFAPGPDFRRGGSPPSLSRAFNQRLAGAWDAFGYVVVVTALLVIPGVVIPAMMKIFIDRYLVLNLTDWLRPLLLAMAIGVALNTIMTWLQQRYLLRLQISLALTMGASLLRHLLSLPAEFFSQRFSGDLNNRVQSVTRVASVLAGGLSANLVGLLSLIFYGLIMASYSLSLTAIGVVSAAISLIATRIVWAKRRDANRLQLKAQGKVAATATNGLQNIETVKASGAERDLFDRWAGAQAQYVTVQQDIGTASAAVNALPTLLNMLGGNLVLCLGAFRVVAGELTIGDLIAFQTLLGSFNAPIRSLVSLGTTLPQTAGDIARIDDVLNYDARRATADAPPAKHAKLRGQLELRNVTFGYSPLAPPLIRELSLTVRAGERVALVGQSGSGKSTVVRLVAGLFAPWSGEVLIDGIPVERIDPLIRANSVSLVDQDIVLFGATVRENITLWDDTVSDDDIVAAARDAEIHHVIAARPGNYQGQISEAARNFSGGERQRIEIARALSSRPSLLLMDEATSALDPIVEKQIDDNIRRRGCGCLIVAHRLSTIRDCEEIIVLKRGKVVQRGSHDGLMREGGEYGRLINAQ